LKIVGDTMKKIQARSTTDVTSAS